MKAQIVNQSKIEELAQRFIQGESNWELEDDLRNQGLTTGESRVLVGKAMTLAGSSVTFHETRR